MKKAVIYGGGKIGRGFIGMLFSRSGYEVSFVNRSAETIDLMNTRRQYSVRYVSSGGYEDETVSPIAAIDGNNPEAVSDAIADCDIMATSVGARALEKIVPILVSGIRKRWAAGKEPLNIIICENVMDANLLLEKLIKAELSPSEYARFDETVGLIEASIGRMVPIQTEEMTGEDPLRICVEKYGFLPVDKAAFRGEIPEIDSMVPFSPFDFYVKRKLYIHNMGHATCAYLGNYLGLEYIYESIGVGAVRCIVQNAMTESAAAMSRKYGVEIQDILDHVNDLLYRFTNAALGDTCERVGADPARKLSPADRMTGSSKTALEQGIFPAYICVGAAAAVMRYINETDGLEQSRETALKVLSEVSKLEEPELKDAILGFYDMLLDRASPEELLRRADELKHIKTGDVI